MAKVLIEMDRGNGWEPRVDAEMPMTADELCRHLGPYALQYPHRAWLDGVLIATAKPVRSKAVGKVSRV